MYDLRDKVSLITGSAGGLGKEFAHRLLSADGGRVCLSDVNREEGFRTLTELREKFGKSSVHFVVCDVTSQKSFEAAFEETLTHFGVKRLDILVNNAGVMGEREGWKLCMDINLRGVLIGTNIALADNMCDVVVNVASILGLFNAKQPKGWAYNTSKSAVVTFSRCLSSSSSSNVRVLCLCPSVADTPILRSLSETEREKMRKEVGGFMTPEQVGEAFVSLVTDGQSGSVMAVWKDCPPYYVPDLGFPIFVALTTSAMILRFVPGLDKAAPVQVWKAVLVLLVCIPLSWVFFAWLAMQTYSLLS